MRALLSLLPALTPPPSYADQRYDSVEALTTNITMGDLWLKGMADGADAAGLSVQYCMPYASHVMSAAAYPAVTNARATGDYFHGFNQWAVGSTSLFYWAIGILPFKDGFYSSSKKQVGGQTVGPEKSPDREALMATLSCAMVGAMDGIYLLNKTRLMTTCMADGAVLRPDVPVHTSDSCFIDGAGAKCYVYHTWTDLEANGVASRVHYHYNDAVAPLTPAMVHLTAADVGKYVVRNWYNGDLTLLAASNALAAGYEGHVYAVASPILAGGWTFLGEIDKFVVAASKRFGKVTSSSSAGLAVEVKGLEGESVKVCAAKASDLKAVCNAVTFAAAGTKTTTFK